MRTSKRYEQAAARLRTLAGFGAPYGARVGAEQEYREAYDEMVRDGAAPKLRGKYRAGNS